MSGDARLLSTAVYEHATAMDFASAHLLALGLLLTALLLLIPLYALNRHLLSGLWSWR